jgi:hypothetical protein
VLVPAPPNAEHRTRNPEHGTLNLNTNPEHGTRNEERFLPSPLEPLLQLVALAL